MATRDDFTAVLAAIDVETTRIGVKIQSLIDQIAAGGLSPTEEQSVLTAIGAAAARLTLIGADSADPVPVDPNP
jgi:hypothetical protein